MAATNQADLVKALVDAGVHFGHRVSRWNPKMEPYIHGKKNMIHIINVKETVRGLMLAKRLIQRVERPRSAGHNHIRRHNCLTGASSY